MQILNQIDFRRNLNSGVYLLKANPHGLEANLHGFFTIRLIFVSIITIDLGSDRPPFWEAEGGGGEKQKLKPVPPFCFKKEGRIVLMFAPCRF